MEKRAKKIGSAPRSAMQSVEEVILKRKMDASDPLTWPEVGKALPGTVVKPQNSAALLMSKSHGSLLLSTHSGVNNNNMITGFNGSNSNDSPQFDGFNSQIGNRGGKSVRFDDLSPAMQHSFSDHDKSLMIASLKDYCRSLEHKVKELETEVVKSTLKLKVTSKENEKLLESLNNKEMAPSVTVGPPEPHKTHKHKSSARPSTPETKTQFGVPTASLPSEIRLNMSEIDVRMVNLREIFKKGNPLEIRAKASTKIISIVRTFLARRRFNAYLRGRREWMWGKCRMITWVVDILLSNQSKLDANIKRMKLGREVRIMYSVLTKWNIVVRQSLPLRRAVRRKAEELFQAKKDALIQAVWSAMKSVCIGKQSQKEINAERRRVIEMIRTRLSEEYKAKGMSGVVPDADLEKALRKHVITSFIAKQAFLFKRNVFVNGWRRYVLICRKQVVEADRHWFKKRVGLCFFAWSDYTYQVSVGLERKRWPGPRRYEVRYNQKRIDNFAKLRQLKMIMVPWRKYYIVQRTVKHKFQFQCTRVITRCWKAWKTIALHQHAIRVDVVKSWKEYARVMMIKPFQAWSQLVAAARNHSFLQNRVVSFYLKTRSKKLLLLIVRKWRHLAIYGRIDGMYSRQMLIESLNEQKLLTMKMEKVIAQQLLLLEEANAVTTSEIQKRATAETDLSNTRLEVQRYRMITHHLEEEMKRLMFIINIMCNLNPKQIAHLNNLQISQFKFRNRNIDLTNDREEFYNSINATIPTTSPVKKSEKRDLPSTPSNPIRVQTAETPVVAPLQPPSAVDPPKSSGESKHVEIKHSTSSDMAVASENSSEPIGEKMFGALGAFAKEISKVKAEVKSDEEKAKAETSAAAVASAPVVTATVAAVAEAKVEEKPTTPQPPKQDEAKDAPPPSAPSISGGDVPGTNNDVLGTNNDVLGTNNSFANTFNPDIRPSGNYVSDEDMILLERTKFILNKISKASRLTKQENEDQLKFIANFTVEKDPEMNDELIEGPKDKKTIKKPEPLIASRRPLLPAERINQLSDAANAEPAYVKSLSGAPVPTMKDSSSEFISGNMVSTIKIPSGNSKADVELFYKAPDVTIPEINITLRGKNKATKRAGFVTAVKAAVSTIIGTLEKNINSRLLMLATDCYGMGSEFIAGKMLLAIMDFLESGDITGFSEEDRFEWLGEILQSDKSSSDSQEKIEQFLKHEHLVDNVVNNVFVDEVPGAEGKKKHILAYVPPITMTIPSNYDPKMTGSIMVDPTFDSSIVNQAQFAATDRLILEHRASWKDALTALRVMHPGAGNGSGLGKALDEEPVGSQLLSRMIGLNDHLEKVREAQINKYYRSWNSKPVNSRPASRSGADYTSQDGNSSIDEETGKAPLIRLYEEDILKIDEEERIARRNAKIAAGLITEDNDSDEDEEEIELASSSDEDEGDRPRGNSIDDDGSVSSQQSKLNLYAANLNTKK